jgi:HPt (histidine-containing phosphotransfer) domain-containing protein
MAELQARFLERCVGDLQRLEAALAREDLAPDDLRPLIHGLSGAAGTFGFPEVSAAAGFADDAYAAGGAPNRAQLEAVATAVRRALIIPRG